MSSTLTYKDAAKVVIGVHDAVKELCFKTRVGTDVKEAHGAHRIMKDTDGAKAQEAWRVAVRTLHDILRQAVSRLWFDWTERHAARRVMRLARDISEASCYHGPYVTRPSPSSYYIPDAASAAPATRRRRTRQT